MQAAVDHQLTTLVGAHPSYRIALVTFNDEVGHSKIFDNSFKHTHITTNFLFHMKVRVIGDGNYEAITVAGDRLRDMDKLVEIGTNVPLPSAIKNTKDSLSKKVFEYVIP